MGTRAISHLDAQRQGWFEQAAARIDAERLGDLIRGLTAIHSPTGAERAACEFLAGELRSAGMQVQLQALGEAGANCVGRLRGAGRGPVLMLYAPIDTHLEADPASELPWAGERLRADMRPEVRDEEGFIVGLGASNPKSMLATLVEACRAVIEAGVPLTGELLLATAGGGMPRFVPERGNAGISSGVAHLLARGVAPDFGIILKPWDEVYYEHPGMCWFKVTTKGTLGYAGIPRGVPGFRSAIVPAARVILELEQWLAEYPARHESAQVRPEGWISAVRAGWPERAAFPSAATEIHLDVRTNPDQTPAAVAAELDAVMRGICARHPDVQAEWEMTVSCQGSRCDPDHWIVGCATRAWEARHGRRYGGAPKMAGQTDAATIGRLGIPLARLGYDWPPAHMPARYAEGLGGMGVAWVPDLLGPCESIVHAIVDACTRSRAEVGLD